MVLLVGSTVYIILVTKFGESAHHDDNPNLIIESSPFPIQDIMK